MTVIEKIEAQQKELKEKNHRAWVVGEQLKDICRAEPESAAIVDKDLDVKEMSIAKAERKFAEFAKGHGGAVTGFEGDEILREFYGLPGRDADSLSLRHGQAATPPCRTATPLGFAHLHCQGSASSEGGIIDLNDFL